MVRVTCRTCGTRRLDARVVGFRVCRDTGDASYHFACPTCGLLEAQSTAAAVRPVLEAAGCLVVEWSLPAELGERPDGPPLGPSDLAELRAALDRDDWFDRLAGGAS